MAIVSAEDVNLLVWRYLQESGFRHTAFTFAHESAVRAHRVDHGSLPQGALVSLVQKGLQYMELEANLNEENSDIEHEYTSLSSSELLSKDVDELKKLVKSRKRPVGADGPTGSAGPSPNATANGASRGAAGRTRGAGTPSAPSKSEDHPAALAATALAATEEPSPSDDGGAGNAQTNTRSATDEPSGGAGNTDASAGNTTVGAPSTSGANAQQQQQHHHHQQQVMEEDRSNTDDWPPSDVIALEGHRSEVFFGTWCPTSANVLATGSGDGTARIWTVPTSSKSQKVQPTSVELVHQGRESSSKKDITAIAWSYSGQALSTGTYHGDVYVWDREGSLQCSTALHEGPVLALRWNPNKGESIISGGYDGRIVLSDSADLQVQQTATAHRGAVFDVDWRDATTFASGGTDGNVCVFKTDTGVDQPRYLRGHTNEVNAVAWDPTGTLLASCSDDRTARIWNPDTSDSGDVDMEQGRADEDGADISNGSLLQELAEHTLTVYDLSWAPQSKGAQLATASWDGTVKLWDAELGKCLTTLGKHASAVYSVAYSPYYSMVASGAHDRHVRVWSAKDGSLVRSVKCGAGVFKVGWSKDGGKVVATLADSSALVVNLRSSNTAAITS